MDTSYQTEIRQASIVLSYLARKERKKLWRVQGKVTKRPEKNKIKRVWFDRQADTDWQ